MDVKKRISALLGKIVDADIENTLSISNNVQHGDYTSNFAMRFAKQLNKSPTELANQVCEKLKNEKLFSKIEVVPPGFINFWISEEVLLENLHEILNLKDNYGRSDYGNGETWLIEHTSPNPNKAMHIGHLRNNVFGMAVANIADFAGYKVIRDAVDNDRGIAIAKLMWGYLKFGRIDGQNNTDVAYWADHFDEWLTPEKANKRPDRFMDEFYVKGSADFSENKEVEEIVRNMVVLWEQEDKLIWKLWDKVLTYVHDGQALTLNRLGSHWDYVWHEHEHYREGKKMVELGLKKGIFIKSEGAIITQLRKYRIPDTIVEKSDGTSLYITQDLALTKKKKEKFNADKMHWVVGPDQTLALKQVFAVCDQLDIIKVEQCMHLSYGYMSIKGSGKMSSRLGNVLYIDELLDLASNKIYDQIKNPEITINEKKILAEKIGVSAVKYAILKVGRLTDMQFSFEEDLAFDGNSGPYLMYCYVRCLNILAKSGNEQGELIPNGVCKMSDSEYLLLRKLVVFNEIIFSSVNGYSPNLVCSYLFELAKLFSSFYEQVPVVSEKDSDLRAFRLSLVKSVSQVLKNGMELLGMDVVEKM